MSPTKEQQIAIAATATVVAGVVALGIYNKEKTKQLVSAGYTSISASASAAATKTSEGFKAVQSAASSSANSVVSGAQSTWDGVAKKLGLPSTYRLKRVKSFPIVTDDEDDAAAMDQTKKAAKKASKKAAAVMEKAGVSVQVSA